MHQDAYSVHHDPRGPVSQPDTCMPNIAHDNALQLLPACTTARAL
jgi:hypothetical protein